MTEPSVTATTPASAPGWLLRALAAAATSPVAPGARTVLAVTPQGLPPDSSGLLLATAEREEPTPGEPASDAAADLVAAFGAEAMRECQVVYADCFRAAADPAGVAREIADVARVAAGVLVLELASRDADPVALLAAAGARPRPARRTADPDGEVLAVAVHADRAPEAAGEPPLVALCYHRVVPRVVDDPFGLAVSTASFAAHLDALRDRFQIVGPDALAGGVPSDGRPRVLLTFDDAYLDTYLHAYPLLASRGIPAVVFAATGYVGSGRPFWWERLARWPGFAALPPAERDRVQTELRHLPAAERDARIDAMGAPPEDEVPAEGRAATWAMLAEMQSSGLVEIGAHTRWHPSLGRLPAAEMAAEVRGSLDDVEAELGLRPRLFAFPHGSPDDLSAEAVQALADRGVTAAFTTTPGVARPGPHALTSPRLMLVGEMAAASLVRRVEDLLPDAWRDRGRTRRRIAVLSGITANNIGDDAMLVATVRGLRRLDPDAELVVLAEDPSRCDEVASQIDAEILSSPQMAVQRILAGRPEGASAAAPILRLARTLISHREEILAGAPVSGLTEAELEGLRTLMGADGVVDCGGANLSGHWRSYFYEKCLDYLVAAKPLSVLGQGIDPADDPEDVALLNLALSVASEVTVREAVTLEYLESIGSPAAVRVTGDDAADLDPSPDARRDALLAAAGADPQAPYIGFQFRHYLDYSAGDALGELAAHLDATSEATGLPIVGVPMHFHDCDERDHLRALRGRMARPERFLVVEDHLTPGDAKALFAGGRIAIGISYHSAIFSLTSGVPYMGLHRGTHYTQKMQGLARLFALPEIAVPLDGASPGAVAAHATDLIARRDAVSAHLLARTAAIRADVAASRRRFLDRVPHPAARAAEAPVPVGALAWGDLRRTSPVSREWGFDRGRPVDRFYIERFMERNAHRVRGVVCELLNDDYARRYGGDRVERVEILDIDEDNPRATILDDLTAPVRTPEGAFDCFILTQVLPYIHECGAALATAYRSLAPGGSVLVTAPSVIRYHREPEDHWRFTVDSLRRLARDHCPGAEIDVEGHGNVLAASAFLYGLACEELTAEELEVDDPEFPLVITARVTRPA